MGEADDMQAGLAADGGESRAGDAAQAVTRCGALLIIWLAVRLRVRAAVRVDAFDEFEDARADDRNFRRISLPQPSQPQNYVTAVSSSEFSFVGCTRATR